MDRRPLGYLLLAVLVAGCPSNEPELVEPQASAEPGAPAMPDGLLSSVHMGDPRAAAQLLTGFHALEQGTWRWTARNFSVALQTPPGGQEMQLEFGFTIPATVIERLQAITLSARVNGADVGSETYEQPGEHVFTKTVPASTLQGGEAVKVEFELDKALPAGDADRRELGVVAVSVALK